MYIFHIDIQQSKTLIRVLEIFRTFQIKVLPDPDLRLK